MGNASRRSLFPGAVLPVVLLSSSALSQQVQSTQLVPPEDSTYNVFAGGQVALSDGWLAVADIAGNFLGETYLYCREPAGWVLRDVLAGVPGSRFGTSLDLDGDTLAVGLPGLDQPFDGTGLVALYERSGDRWVLVQRIPPPRPELQAAFGWGVALQGDVLAIGAVGEDDPADSSGAVHVFEREGGAFRHVDSARLPNIPAVRSNDYGGLGAALAIDGDVIVAGAPGRLGAALVLQRIGTWQRTSLLTDPAPADGDAFGAAVAVDGGVIVIGRPANAPGLPRRGAAFVFERSGGSWQLSDELAASDGFANFDRSDEFGASVDIRDGVIVVGSVNGRFNGNDTGTVYVFEKRCQGWCETERLVSTSPQDLSQSLGFDVALEGGFVVAGAPGTPTGDPSIRGATYVFERDVSIELCPGDLNSTGSSATATVVGDGASRTLSGRDLPPGVHVALLASTGGPVFPSGPAGVCIGPAPRRIDTARSGPGGTVFFALDSLAQVDAGRINFQLCYRDGAARRYSSAATIDVQ